MVIGIDFMGVDMGGRWANNLGDGRKTEAQHEIGSTRTDGRNSRVSALYYGVSVLGVMSVIYEWMDVQEQCQPRR